MDKERFSKQLDFILEIDKDKNIYRQNHITNIGKAEDDAEHSWHMAIMAYLLKEYSNEEIDIAHVMIMCLIHDIVEIDAGDTFAYDDKGLLTQSSREQKAKERIYSILPQDQAKEMMDLFDEFEENITPEARFAHAMDNFQPILLNNSNNGYDWKRNSVDKSHIYKRQEKTKLGSKEIYDKVDEIIKENIKKGNIKDI